MLMFPLKLIHKLLINMLTWWQQIKHEFIQQLGRLIIEQGAQSTWLRRWGGRVNRNSRQSAYKKTAAKFSSRLHSKACHFKKLQNNYQHHMNSTVHNNSCSLHIRLGIYLYNFRAINLDMIIMPVKSRGTSIPMSYDQFTMTWRPGNMLMFRLNLIDHLLIIR